MRLTARQIHMLEEAANGHVGSDFTFDLGGCMTDQGPASLRAHFNGYNHRTYRTLRRRRLIKVAGDRLHPTESGLRGITT